MKLGEKGWLKEYIEYRKGHYKEKKVSITRHPDISLYNLLQPTGLLYGNPVQPENLGKDFFESLSERVRLKVLLTESLINATLLFQENELKDQNEFSDQLDTAISKVIDFYNKVYPEIATSSKTFFGTSRSKLEVAEKILDKRIELKASSHHNFWIRFFSNALIFLDVYFYAQWIHTATDKMVADFFREEKEELRLTVIKVIVAAAHANHIVEVEEKKLFEYILHAASLSSKRNKEAWNYLEHGILVEEIKLPENNSWLLKKYFLELAILTVSADRIVDEKEKEFLVNFTRHLGFFEDDLDDSMLALEGFILENWTEMGELQDRKNLDQLGSEYGARLSKLLVKHAKKLSNEISQNEAIIRLFKMYKEGTTTSDDEERLRNFLIAVLQDLPVFSSIILPRSFLTLQNLIKILPNIDIE